MKHINIESITVGELIKHLEKFPKSLKVVGLDDMRDPESLSLHNFGVTTIWQHDPNRKAQDVVDVTIIRSGWYAE